MLGCRVCSLAGESSTLVSVYLNSGESAPSGQGRVEGRSWAEGWSGAGAGRRGAKRGRGMEISGQRFERVEQNGWGRSSKAG